MVDETSISESDLADILEKAFSCKFGGKAPSHQEWYAEEIEHRRRAKTFSNLLHAKAWESAVFMLLGSEGWRHMEVYPPQGNVTNYTVHILIGKRIGENPKGYAPTLAGAMCLAISNFYKDSSPEDGKNDSQKT